MKKLIALLLCVVMITATLASCAHIKQDADDKGAEIPVYMSGEIYNLDPAYAYEDDAAAEILSLIYEGLFTLNEKGEAEKALCKSYETYTDRDGQFVCEFTLNDTCWSDGRSVSANDFVFAWKRILEPEFSSKACALLFDIKNAIECKNGDVSIDDLGVAAAETKVLQVTFKRPVDIDQFILTLASPALVPLREDKVHRLTDWASYYATMATDGPFFVKIFTPGEGYMTLERNNYYYRDIESETEKLDKYVTPYRINISFEKSKDAYKDFNDEKIVLDSELPLDERADAKVTTLNTLSTATYVFNTTKAPFDNADVRKALSLAIDRNELVDIVKYATVAEGVIPAGVKDGKKDFRSGDALISAKADMDAAKKLVKGASEKNITITIRDNEIDKAVANYVKGQWEKLGFKVELRELTFEHYTNIDYDQYKDLFHNAYLAGDFDVIAIDSQMLSTNAFGELASFAKEFSGMGMNLSAGDYSAVPHISGYDNKDYNDLIAKAFDETDSSKKSELLHKAEAMLCDDMPVMPLFVYQNAYVKNSALSKLSTNYFGALIYTEAKLKGYEKWKVEEE